MLRQFVPQVASGAIRDGMMDFAGLGRGALAYPSAPADIFAKSRMEACSACAICFACSQLRDDGESVGCVLRDPETYGPIYRQMRRFDADQLLAGAARCHLCEAAPCISASPTRTDIPAFINAFRNGDESRAYEIIRTRDALPELTSRLSPAWLESEGGCIETTLTGTPVPILDLTHLTEQTRTPTIPDDQVVMCDRPCVHRLTRLIPRGRLRCPPLHGPCVTGRLRPGTQSGGQRWRSTLTTFSGQRHPDER